MAAFYALSDCVFYSFAGLVGREGFHMFRRLRDIHLHSIPRGNRKLVHPLSGRMTADFTTFYDFLPSFNSCTGSFEYFELAVTQWIGTWETTDEVCPALE